MDVGDVLNLVRGAPKVEHALVDTHLEAIESDGTLTARSLAGHDAQELGGHADGANGTMSLVHSTILEFGAH